MATLKKMTVIGLNSGTSMDGIDAAIFSISPGPGTKRFPSDTPPLEVKQLHSTLVPFADQFRSRLQNLLAGQSVSWRDVCLANTQLGELFAEAALSLLQGAGISPEEVDLIGSHGQTVWHAPDASEFWGRQTRGTLQLGEPAIIWARTNIPVVADFRPFDLAAGGQGAPLVSFADEVLFGQFGTAYGVLNLGGIANITVINEKGQAVMAFDTGPGNMVIDYMCDKLFGLLYDEQGAIAGRGHCQSAWLNEILSDPYFKRQPPKTTGRELFGHQFAARLLNTAQERQISGEDTLATVTAVTAKSIAAAYADFVQNSVRLEKIIVGGGGAENIELIRSLKHFWPHELEVLKHEDFGISAKFKEALLFALLAYTTYFGIPNNVPACTGASKRVCLGKLIGATRLNDSQAVLAN